MRKLIAAFKVSLDGKINGPQGFADWVDAWSENYGLTPSIDACLLGAGMYPGYEAYWSAMQAAPGEPLPMTGKLPTPAELHWADFAAKTPHYVLSTTLGQPQWAHTTLLRNAGEVAALKEASGKDIYLMGGAQLTSRLMDAGLVDELRLIVYPLLAGGAHDVFPAPAERQMLDLLDVQQLTDGLIRLDYRILRKRASE